MKQFILKVSGGGLLLLTILHLATLMTPYYWGNESVVAKFNYFEAEQESFDIIFLGSSRFYFQIDPTTVDQTLDNNFHSFNMASAAVYVPEMYYLYERLLPSLAEQDVKYAVLELQRIDAPTETEQTRKNYFLTYDLLSLALKSIWQSPHWEKYGYQSTITKNYLIGYMHNFLKLNFRGVIDYWYQSYHTDIKPVGYTGFVVEDNDESFHEYRAQIRTNFLENDLALFQTTHEAVKQLYAPNEHDLHLDQVHLAKINELIEQSENTGVHLIFVLPPRLFPEYYTELLPLWQEIPPQHRIDLANPYLYPQFYSLDYSLDTVHLTLNGALLFSESLANELKPIITENDG
ncbi:MAG TPA: hypothetical protein VLL52_11560 [Anaerolineae bacterium]|nr:hypothetical protein [Anaerolineae bacterium]